MADHRYKLRLATWTTSLGLLAAVACGGGIRLYQAWSASVIARDGIGYVNMAREMRDNWRAGVPELVQFGYPLLIEWAYPLVGDRVAGDDLMRWQRTAQIVSVLCGTLCIPAIYWLGRRLLSRRVGLLAAWGWALLPDAVRFSADALSDMPCLMFMLWAAVFAMVALRRRSIGHFVWAGVLSGAAYAIREEGGAVAFVAVVLALTRGRTSLFWRTTAVMAVVAGFAVLGGSYIWIEGGSIFSEKPYLHVDVERLIEPGCVTVSAARGQDELPQSGPPGACGTIHPDPFACRRNCRAPVEPCRALFAMSSGQPSSRAPMLAALDFRPFTEQIKDVLHVSWTEVARQAFISLHQLLLEMVNSLNGLWLMLGAAYFVLPGRQRFRRGWRRLPLLLIAVHVTVLLLLFAKCGYLSRRHVMLLDVWVVIAGAGTLTWIAGRLTSRLAHTDRPVTRRRMTLASRADGLILVAIVLSTLPWLLRDVGEGRWFMHDAARWIQQQYPGRSDLRIVCRDAWIPFYARQSHWDLVISDVQDCPQLQAADLLIRDHKMEAPPSSLAVAGSKQRLQITPAARFTDARGGRWVEIYRVERLPATTSPAK